MRQCRRVEVTSRRKGETKLVKMSLLSRAMLPLLQVSLIGAGLTSAATPYALQQPPLTTDWTEEVGTNPWPEYPRPQLQRPQWQNLNGVWQYRDARNAAAIDSPPFGQSLDTEVLVPSCLESGLSGKPPQLLDLLHQCNGG